MQTLVPATITRTAEPRGRWAGILGFALTQRALVLIAVGSMCAIPAFFHPHRLWLLLVWNGVLASLIAADLNMLPPARDFTLTRRFLHSPQVGVRTEVEIEVLHNTSGLLDVSLIDDLQASLTPVPQVLQLRVYPREPGRILYVCFPRERGQVALGNVYLRYRGAFHLAERWAVAKLEQQITVFPATELSGDESEMYLMRARQIEQQRRKLRRIGIGREFQNLRDYHLGDEMRDISWTATARRSRLITRQYSTERSQQVWIVLDAGRLSRTNFKTVRSQSSRASSLHAFSNEIEKGEAVELSLTQLDEAAASAVLLARVIDSSGDKFALLTYGRSIQQQLPPGKGPLHLRLLIEALAKTHSETADADASMAGLRLRNLQRRRGLVLWISEIAETASRPEIAIAAADLARRHLVVLVLLRHPELNATADAPPAKAEDMYVSAAAQQMIAHQREVVRSMRSQGILIVETTPQDMAQGAINKYLEVKAQGKV